MHIEATNVYSNPTQRWEEMSRASTTINRIKIAVSAVFGALGVAAMATGAAILATIGLTPAGPLLLTLGVLPTLIGITALAFFGMSDPYNYSNPEIAKSIVKTLREGGIDTLADFVYSPFWGFHNLSEIESFGNYGIMPKEHVAPLQKMVSQYILLERQEQNLHMRNHGPGIKLEKQNSIITQKNALNLEWTTYRQTTKLVSQLPQL